MLRRVLERRLALAWWGIPWDTRGGAIADRGVDFKTEVGIAVPLPSAEENHSSCAVRNDMVWGGVCHIVVMAKQLDQ